MFAYRRWLLYLLLLLIATLAALPVAADTSASSFSSDLARDWSDLHLRLIRRTWGFSPPVAARALGYLGVTLYESVVPGMPDHQSLVGQLNGLDELPQPIPDASYHWPSAANSALAAMTRMMFPTTHAGHKAAIDELYARYAAEYQLATDADTFARSVEFGQQIADAIYEWSMTDGGHEGYRRNFPADFEYPVGEGLWQPTQRSKGNPQRPMQPRWGENRPFVLASGAECAPEPPPAYSEDPESDFYAEAFEVYDTVNNLTAEQLEIARFWADDPFRTATPAGHSISILTQVLERENASLATAAEAYARVGIGISDAFISCWNTKFQYNLIRPVTYTSSTSSIPIGRRR